jgi:type I restriction enzyme M protein
MLFDRVIANPPFSLDKWGIEVAENDGFGRFRHGVPPKTKGDFAFVQHMISTLNQKGKLGVVVPHGVLFRGAAEGKIRENIIKEDLIEAIISLPGKNQNHLRDEDIAKITKAYNDFKPIEKYCRAVDITELKENDYNLNISRYIDVAEAEEQIDLHTAVKELHAVEIKRKEVEEKMNKYLEELGCGRK